MKKIVLTYGLILGTIATLSMLYMVHLCYNNPYMESNDTVGYAAMLVVYSIIFVGIKNYRDKENDGNITFGKAFKTGFLIALLASTMYVVVWLIAYYSFFPDFMDKYTLHVLNEAKRDGLNQAQIQVKAAEMAEFNEMYKNPVMVALITYAEALPMGIVVALISSLVLKKGRRSEVGGLKSEMPDGE
jgi:amino acid transporter